MFTPDYDDYYNLNEYASRFVSDPGATVESYFTLVSTMNLVTMWELDHGNDLFSPSAMEAVCDELRRGDIPSVGEIRDRCNILCYFIEDGEVFADLDVYNGFVAYLSMHRINL